VKSASVFTGPHQSEWTNSRLFVQEESSPPEISKD
jgi:hypothetical protein